MKVDEERSERERRSTYCRRRRKDEIKGEKKRSTQRRGDQRESLMCPTHVPREERD